MIKRINKNISMLLAAAAVASLVPVQGVSASEKKLDTKDGAIESAVAYKDGKYLFDGYEIKDDEEGDSGIYFNDGNKSKIVEDEDDNELTDTLEGVYGEKYAVTDESDEYIIDLETGKTVDDDVDSLTDDAKTQLKKQLKKVDRYEVEDEGDITSFERLKNNNFGEVWYQYKAATGDTKNQSAIAESLASIDVTVATASTTSSAVVIAGTTISKVDVKTADNQFTNATEFATALDLVAKNADVLSKYDVSVANGVYTFKEKVAGKIADTDFSGAGVKVTQYVAAQAAQKVSAGQYFGFTNKNGKYIDANFTANIQAYSSAKKKIVKIEQFNDLDSDSKLEASLNNLEVIGQDSDYIYAIATVTISDNGKDSQAKYIQKISKAQGSEEDDAYTPKSVTSYELTSGVYDESDVDDAYTAITTADKLIVKDGKLQALEIASDSITVTTVNLKTNSKLEFVSAPDGYDSKDKASVNVAIKEDDADQDIEGADAYSIDVDGNVWVVNNGKILKFNGEDDFDTVYSCDGSMDKLNVYDSSNLVVWEDGGDVYAVVGGKSSDSGTGTGTDGTTPVVTPVVTNGWTKDATTGVWTYAENGVKATSKWVLSNNAWYFLQADGSMKTGWLQDKGVWYFLQDNGAMKTGWVQDKGTWYFLQDNGSMKTGWVQDNGAWYFLQDSGAMKTGWLNDNGTWYFLNANGSMAANTTIDGYTVDASGAWVK